MPSTVLGKRARPSLDRSDSKCGIVTRAKRRTQFVVLDNNENENPFITRETRKDSHHDDETDLDELASVVTPSSRSRTANSAPAKHGTPRSRVFPPVTKVNACAEAAKPAIEATTCPIRPQNPHTPRHRDALGKKIVVTPSRRVPVTPSHRRLTFIKPSTPQTPRTPTTPRTSVPTVYHEARQAFARSVQPGRLAGRDTERTELLNFATSRMNKKSSGCIYISGPPGTGKSALVNEVSRQLMLREDCKVAYINCMSMKTTSDIFCKLLDDFNALEGCLEGEQTKRLENLFRQTKTSKANKKSYLVVLDEIDHLLGLDLDLLYTLFKWSFDRSSNLILVGIANALDLTDRFLPRLKAEGLKPQLLPFMPYTATQIVAVITEKLKALNPSPFQPDFVPFLHPTAILFLAKKVAAQTGDLRKAFDICRRAIDMIEAETIDQHAKKAAELTPSPSPSKTPLVENMNLSSPPATRSPRKPALQTTRTSSLAQLTPETAPRATIAHMARITALVFGNGTTQRLQSLNLQQKAVLCSLAALEKKQRDSSMPAVPVTPSKHNRAAPTIKALFEAYSSLCRSENVLQPLTSTEFRDVIGNLETLSLVAAVEGKTGSLAATGTPSRKGRGGFGATVMDERRVASCVGMKELTSSLDGVGSGILRGILEGEGLA